ncbi:CoA transferase [Kribbella sp. NPDC049227]|uniref:CoA transferase n=1 Tax=Kribbella sp. NPDC049227 TaxID=3364113 RepID=UPI0037208B04
MIDGEEETAVMDVSGANGSGPLTEVTVAQIGDSPASRFLSRLLTEQGAAVHRITVAEIDRLEAALDVVITEGDADASLVGRLRSRYPDLVHCSLVGLPGGSPYTWDGLDDRVLAAVLGLHRRSGLPVQPEPLRVASFYGALMAGVYVAAALVRGGPADIRVPLLSAALTALSRDLVRADNPDLIDIGPLPHLPNVELYRCADGRYLQPHGLYENFVRILCQVIGRPEWAEEAVAGLHELPGAEAVQRWRDRFAEAFLERPALEWERLINEAGGVATMVRSRDEWAAEAHPFDAQILAEESTPGPAVRVTAHPADPQVGTGPRPDRNGLPLTGVRVVDFCIVLAGPTCGRILAELGADVVKVDDPRRHISPYPWLDVNRSKRSIVLDLRTAGGAELARELIAGADVVVQNFRAGKIDELGFGPESVLTGRPDLVYASLNAFDFDGSWQHRPGWEHNAQAASGMQIHRARNGVPRQVPFPVNDYATGLLGAFGVLVALRRRQSTGIGSRVRASLARSATYMQQDLDDSAVFGYVACVDGGVWVQGALESGLEAKASTQSARDAVAFLEAAGYRAVRESSPDDPETRAWLFETGLLTRWRHPQLGWLEQATPRPDQSDLHRTDGWPAPQPGADTAEILAGLGLPAERIAALHAEGAIHAERSFLTP